MRKSTRGQPLSRDSIVGDSFACKLERGSFRGPAVANAEDIVPAAVESKAGEAEARQDRRQKAQRPDIKVHRIAVEQQHGSRARPALGLVECTVKRRRVGRNGDQFSSHVR